MSFLGYIGYYFIGSFLGGIIDAIAFGETSASIVTPFSLVGGTLGIATYYFQQRKGQEWMKKWFIYITIFALIILGLKFAFSAGLFTDLPTATNQTITKRDMTFQQPAGWNKLDSQSLNERFKKRYGEEAEVLGAYQHPDNQKQLILFYLAPSKYSYNEFFTDNEVTLEDMPLDSDKYALQRREVIGKNSSKWVVQEAKTSTGYNVLEQFTIADDNVYSIRYLSPLSSYTASVDTAKEIMNHSRIHR